MREEVAYALLCALERCDVMAKQGLRTGWREEFHGTGTVCDQSIR